ncbi:hypothetical protein BGZ63DRAFT_392781 [Mariannaea sp. PMI_226]|nr:hypothetical protein BGZ63DRAFT_392781 [Mariannaea sp. PMI_226]
MGYLILISLPACKARSALDTFFTLLTRHMGRPAWAERSNSSLETGDTTPPNASEYQGEINVTIFDAFSVRPWGVR